MMRIRQVYLDNVNLLWNDQIENLEIANLYLKADHRLAKIRPWHILAQLSRWLNPKRHEEKIVRAIEKTLSVVKSYNQTALEMKRDPIYVSDEHSLSTIEKVISFLFRMQSPNYNSFFPVPYLATKIKRHPKFVGNATLLKAAEEIEAQLKHYPKPRIPFSMYQETYPQSYDKIRWFDDEPQYSFS